jgi:glycosyltransferase involved in cell wall biosynthesis
MKVSVITACYNAADTIRATIESVLAQDYRDIEYIIVDGESKDKTLSVVREFGDKITRVHSEKDGGIYFALNKGLKLANGEVIAFLHADDIFASKTVISDVVKKFEESHADGVYGDLQYVDRQNTNHIVRNWKSGHYHPGMFLKGWMPPHPSLFLKRSCYERYGIFNTEFRTAADYELMLRFIHLHKIKIAYLHEVLVKMRVGGMSNLTLANRIKANREDKKAWLVNGLKPGMFTLVRKPLSKVVQYFR